MKRYLFALLALTLVSGRVSAQPLDTGTITAGGADCTTAARCFIYALPNATISSITLQVHGTFSATLQFEGTSSADPNNATWFALSVTKLSDGSTSTSTTATGQYSIANSGLTAIRVRCSSYSSGTANITAVRGYAMGRPPSPFFSTTLYANALCLDTTNQDVCLERDGANALGQRRGTNAQTFSVYRTYTDASNYGRFSVTFSGSDARLMTQGAGAVGAGDLYLGAAGSATWRIKASDGSLVAATDNTTDIGATAATRPRYVYIAGPSITVGSGTGITVASSGDARDLTYRVTIASTAFVCAAVTCDVTIATLPADTHLSPVYAKLTTTFACAATCTTSTLSMVLGKGSGGAEYLASFDADAATAVFGDADAEMGTLLTRAAAIQGGTYNTASQVVVLRLTSGTGNIGNGSATNLSQGSVTVSLSTRVVQ